MWAFKATVEIIPSKERQIFQELIQAMIDRASELVLDRGSMSRLPFSFTVAGRFLLKLVQCSEIVFHTPLYNML
jgi:hypothetical protein